MNRIVLTAEILLEEFLNRLPPIVKRMFIENIDKKFGFARYEKEYETYKRTFASFKNDIAWKNTPQGQTFWEYLKSAKIVLDIPFPTGNLGFSINLGDYYCRNEQYESLMKDIKSKKIEEFDIESFKMVIVDVKGVKWN